MSTEAEVRHKRSRRQAVITRRLVPLSGREAGPVGFGSREWNRELLKQAFDDGTVELKMRLLKFGSLWAPHFFELFRPFSR